MNSKSTNPLMKQNSKEENNMSMLMGLVLPIAIVVLTYAKSRYDRKKQVDDYNAVIRKAALDIMAQIKSLPKGD